VVFETSKSRLETERSISLQFCPHPKAGVTLTVTNRRENKTPAPVPSLCLGPLCLRLRLCPCASCARRASARAYSAHQRKLSPHHISPAARRARRRRSCP